MIVCGGGLRHCVNITDAVCCGSCSDTSEVLFYVRSIGDHLFYFVDYFQLQYAVL